MLFTFITFIHCFSQEFKRNTLEFQTFGKGGLLTFNYGRSILHKEKFKLELNAGVPLSIIKKPAFNVSTEFTHFLFNKNKLSSSYEFGYQLYNEVFGIFSGESESLRREGEIFYGSLEIGYQLKSLRFGLNWMWSIINPNKDNSCFGLSAGINIGYQF